MVRELTAADVEFSLACYPEDDVPYVGNCMASGDDRVDRKAERWIERQLERGNEWAWCRVEVTATWDGFTGDAHLGCCSYRSEKSFCAPGGYYDDLKAEALDNLNTAVAAADAQLERLRS